MLRGERRSDGGDVSAPSSAPSPSRRAPSAVEFVGSISRRADVRARKPRHLRCREREREDPLDRVQRLSRPREEVQVHLENDLALDEQVDVEDELVERQVDRALDGVLERHERRIDLAVRHQRDRIRDGRRRDELGIGEVGLAEQGLFGEGATRARG